MARTRGGRTLRNWVSTVVLVAWGVGSALAMGSSSHSTVSLPQDEPDPFRFTSDAAIVMYTVKADATADFEIVWRVIRQRVASSDDDAAKAQLDGMKTFEPESPNATAVTYVFYIDPVVHTASYSPTFILFESGLFERPEADELFATLTGALVAEQPISTMPLNLVP